MKKHSLIFIITILALLLISCEGGGNAEKAETTAAPTVIEANNEKEINNDNQVNSDNQAAETPEAIREPDIINEKAIERLTLEKLANTEGNIYVATDGRYKDLADKLRKTVTEAEFPGSIVVATDSDIIYSSGTDVLQKDGTVVTPYTGFQIGSVSKTYTATCILKLVEDGVLSTEDTVGSFLPECDRLKDITVYQLLHMNTGLTDVVNYLDKAFRTRGGEFLEEVNAGTLTSERLTDYFNDLIFIFEPGERVQYSNTNYLILGIIIEKITGEAYNDFLYRTILEPLGMTATTIGNPEATECVYTAPDIPILFTRIPALTKGAGDITSSVLDMLQFDRALFSGVIINQESLRTMLEFKDNYSCGWMKDETRSVLHSFGNYYWKASDSETVYHGGRIPGFMSYNIVLNIDGERIYVIMLFTVDENSEASVTGINQRINAILKQF